MNNNNEKSVIHGYVSGRVQGVGFRAFTQKNAIDAGITGWAKNLIDGRVEFILYGDTAAVNQLVDKITKGPLLANVTHIETEQLPLQKFEGFSTH